MASANKRHHQVPRFYLERFSDSGKVTVRWRDGRTYATSPVNVAVESGYYDIPDGVGGVSKEIENGLADIETMADQVFKAIDRSGQLPSPSDPDTATLALFVGLQMARTTSHRERVLFPRRVVDWAAGREVTREAVDEYLSTQYLGFPPEPGEVDGAYTVVRVAMDQEPRTLTDEFAVEMMLTSAIEISRRLLPFNWSIEFDVNRAFMTSDSPVVLWRKPTPRDEYEGLGIENAAEIRFPLDPGKQLVFSRRLRRSRVDVGGHRVRRSNSDMAGAAHRFILGSPQNARQIAAARLDRWRPLIRFNVGPMLQAGTGGQVSMASGDVVHMWTPRRAAVGRPRDPKRAPATR